MSSVRYEPLSKLLKKFKDAEEDIYEDLRNSDISWGAEKQITLGEAEYIHDVIEEHLQGRIDHLTHASEIAELGKYQGYLNTLQGIRGSATAYYCMEE